jgi:bifunctional non-homologous end joining protein LigD
LHNLHGVKKSDFIPNPKPMLATLTEKAFDSSQWIYEIKWDGYRALAEIKNGKVLLYSRNGISFNNQFEPVVISLGKLPVDNAVLDGEIVVLDESGKSDFQLLQQYLRTGKGSLAYYIFDILFINGLNLYDTELITRKKILKEIIKPEDEKIKDETNNIRLSDYIENNGNDFYKIASENGLEGIIAKKKDSIYEPDKRSRNWLKIKSRKSQEVIICGYTDPRGSRQKIGSLITGVYDNGELVFTGQVGGGLDNKEIDYLYSKLQEITTENQPFKVIPKTNNKPHWVVPSLVAEVEFAEWTGENLMRQPVYIGLRIDKKAEEVFFEKAENIFNENTDKNAGHKEDKNIIKEALMSSKVTLTNPDKIFWPDEKYTKKVLFEYYKRISSFILPYIKDRLQSLNRCPDGISGECFYQKDIDYQLPDWLKTKKIYSESKNEFTNYLICQDLDSLLYMVNLGCIDIHPWSSTVENLERPDFAILDLDPLEVDFKKVVSVAIGSNKLFEEIKVDSYCKTTGFKGIHIYIPLGGQYTFDQALDFVKIIALVINSRLPDLTSIERSPAKRHGKVYLDCYQNRSGQTVAAPYCIRPIKGANVSTPLLWDELQGDLDPGDFNIGNIFARLDKVGDIWKGVLGPGIDMGKCIDRLKEILKEPNQPK